MNDDGLDAARGIINGLLISAVMWGIAYLLWGAEVVAAVARWLP